MGLVFDVDSLASLKKGLFLYGTFGHGALKLDMSTLFATYFLRTSLQFINKLRYISGVVFQTINVLKMLGLYLLGQYCLQLTF